MRPPSLWESGQATVRDFSNPSKAVGLGGSMVQPSDWFTMIEWVIFRLFVLGCLVIAVVRILAKELGSIAILVVRIFAKRLAK
jgi:hypothetical protein